ncbi:MAG: iron-sulfur cluster repair di-iron protein, partial [Bryobacterales bacterium]|nr:iron-sulfur cluster repair di-iron protein [Bryobacterales bacterium]
MSNTPTTVAQIAANSLSAVRVFEKWGIDYCCGGKRPLADICLDKGLDDAAIEAELNSTAPDPSGQTDWNQAPLADLIEHLLSTHHEYLRRELPVLAARLEKVYRVYNQRYGPTLTGLPEVFAALREELETHLQKEEQVLFPALIVGEAARKTGTQPPPTCFGTVANPIRMMEAEHASASQGLERIREITAGFHIPDYACVTYRALMYGLEELESDLQLHMHLENNILFPRA